MEKEIASIIKKNNFNNENNLILWDGYCRICHKEGLKCTYDSGEPCRYKPRYSMEAVGINVDQTVKNAGFNLEWPPKKFAYRFGLICTNEIIAF
jgi:predicted metal-binding protein